MTKSRTLRRAGAVVLSLAMAATTVFAGNVSQAASKKKVTLSSTSKTFAAEGGTATVKVKGATKARVKSLKVSTSDSSVATAKKSSVVKFKVTAKENTTAKKKTATITAKVTLKKKTFGKVKYTKKTYSLKYKVTVKATETSSDDDGNKLIEGVVKLTSGNALQSDGTVLVGDSIALAIPGEVGVVTTVQWLCNGNIMNTTDNSGTGGLGFKTTAAGTWTALVKTEGKNTYISNALDVTDKQAPVTITGAEILEDYSDANDDNHAGDNVVYNAVSTKLVAHVTVNRLYDGKFTVCDPSAAKLAPVAPGDVVTVKEDATNEIVQAVKSTGRTTASDGYGDFKKSTPALKDVIGTATTTQPIIVGAFGQAADIYFEIDDTGLTRGTNYVAVFDQDEITTDGIGDGAENKSSAVAAPYVKAPTKFTATSFKSTSSATLELGDETGKFAWLNGANESSNGIKFTSCAKTGLPAADSDSFTAAAGAVVDGVFTDGNNVGAQYYYAKAELGKGIYGAESTTLTSNIIETAGVALSGITVAQSDTTATSATVTLSNLKSDAAGKVYVFVGLDSAATGGDADAKAADAFGKLSALDLSKAKNSATVTGGQTSVEVPNVFSAVDTTDTYKNYYVAVYVPDDQAKYLSKAGGVDATHANILTQKLAKYAAVTSKDVTNTTADIGLKGIDQFGKEIANKDIGPSAITVTNLDTGKTAEITITNGDVGTDPATVAITAATIGTFTFTSKSGNVFTLVVSAANTGKLTIA